MAVTRQFPKIHMALPQSRKASSQFRLRENFHQNQTNLQSVVTFQWHLICHLPNSWSYLILIASLLSWQQISLRIKSSNQGEITSRNLSLVLEEFWGEISAVHSELKKVQCSESLFVCSWFLLVLDPQGLCSTNRCFLVPFSLWLSGLTITEQTGSSHWPSRSLWEHCWQIFHRKNLQTMYTNIHLLCLTLLPDDKGCSSSCPENPWWPLIISTPENGPRWYPCNWMYLVLHWCGKHKLFFDLPWTALSWKHWGK